MLFLIGFDNANWKKFLIKFRHFIGGIGKYYLSWYHRQLSFNRNMLFFSTRCQMLVPTCQFANVFLRLRSKYPRWSCCFQTHFNSSLHFNINFYIDSNDKSGWCIECDCGSEDCEKWVTRNDAKASERRRHFWVTPSQERKTRQESSYHPRTRYKIFKKKSWGAIGTKMEPTKHDIDGSIAYSEICNLCSCQVAIDSNR